MAPPDILPVGRIFRSSTLNRAFDDRMERGLKIQIRANFPQKSRRERRAILANRMRLIFKGRDYKLPTDVNRRSKRYFEDHLQAPKEQVRSRVAMGRRTKLSQKIIGAVAAPVPDEVQLVETPGSHKFLTKAMNRLRGKK